MSDFNREIIKKIFHNYGIFINDQFGKFGITRPELRLDKTMNFNYSSQAEEIKFPMYAGKVVVDKATIKSLFVDLSLNENEHEFILVIRANENPIHVISLFIEDDSDAVFLIGEKSSWEEASTVIKCKTLIATELIASHGLIWEKITEIDDLLSAANHIATTV